MTYQIVTDSCCDLPYTFLKEKNVPFISMTVIVDGQEYFDDLGENFKPAWLYEQLAAGKMPTTSQISPGRYLDFFRPYAEKNIPLLYLCFSSGLSGSYQSALQAVELLKEEYPDADVTVFDTKNACLGEGLVVYYAALMQEAQKPLAEIIDWVTKNAIAVHSFVKVEDLEHLKRSGRISKTAAVLGNLMNIKPLLVMDSLGKLQNVAKARGNQKAMDRLVEDTVATIQHPENQTLFIAHADDLASATGLKEQLMARLPIKDVLIYPMGATISSHTGLGCIALFSIGTPRTL
ncbi:DegV family protein [Enterococcus timonensis]|uniref:DegV family protein n=1 Tax=Enterococcus timonensis TaxID=1852364 RepID=UPI0008D99271|nr:DegV family protein [Enterococcus timonensis]